MKAKSGGNYYSYAWRRCSYPSPWPFELVVGGNFSAKKGYCIVCLMLFIYLTLRVQAAPGDQYQTSDEENVKYRTRLFFLKRFLVHGERNELDCVFEGSIIIV